MFQEGISLLESFYNLSAIFTAVSVIILGLFVFFKNTQSAVNRSYLVFMLSFALWSFALFLCQINGDDPEKALLWNRILHTGATLIPLTVLAHFLIFLGIFNKRKGLMIVLALYTVIIVVLDLATPLIIKGMIPKWYFRLWPVPGPLYPAFLLLFFFCFTYSILLVYFGFLKATGLRRSQLKLYLMAVLIASSGGSANYFLFYNIRVHPLANWFCFFYSVIIAYAVIRHKLFEIDTVIHKTILWMITILFLILPVGLLYGIFRQNVIKMNPVAVAGLISFTLLFFLAYYNRLKPRIDHLFRRRKYDYQLILAELPSRIGSSLNIKLLSQNLFKELKDILYIRNGLLMVKPVDRENFERIDAFGLSLPDTTAPQQITMRHPLINWLNVHQKVLEREQIEIDPQYNEIKEETLKFFRTLQLELLIPLTMQEQLVGILGLGKKENLQSFRIRDVELLEHIGKQ
ncbi:MAG: histidine kinase N-terminal 7TM domain-containing protein, partial [bacterium]|nr:histidine kinase N-terminal 7TM domain-containing protein [bacterium]